MVSWEITENRLDKSKTPSLGDIGEFPVPVSELPANRFNHRVPKVGVLWVAAERDTKITNGKRFTCLFPGANNGRYLIISEVNTRDRGFVTINIETKSQLKSFYNILKTDNFLMIIGRKKKYIVGQLKMSHLCGVGYFVALYKRLSLGHRQEVSKDNPWRLTNKNGERDLIDEYLYSN